MRKEEKNVMSEFLGLVEKISSSKNRPIDFGEGQVFFHREIHIIKVIGDNPGISAGEIAQKFGITPVVVSKILKKMIKEELVLKKTDSNNKSKMNLFLAPRGQAAFKAHEKHHDEFDARLFEFLSTQNEEQLKSIFNFLRLGKSIIERNF